MSTSIDERQLLSGLRRSEIENQDLRRELAAAREMNRMLRRRLRERLTGAQARAVLDENAELRRMNKILVERNTILARRQRQR